MARKGFPTWKRLILSCGCIVGVGSGVNPASVDKCPRHQVKVTAIEEPPSPTPPVDAPALVIDQPEGSQLRLAL